MVSALVFCVYFATFIEVSFLSILSPFYHRGNCSKFLEKLKLWKPAIAPLRPNRLLRNHRVSALIKPLATNLPRTGGGEKERSHLVFPFLRFLFFVALDNASIVVLSDLENVRAEKPGKRARPTFQIDAISC